MVRTIAGVVLLVPIIFASHCILIAALAALERGTPNAEFSPFLTGLAEMTLAALAGVFVFALLGADTAWVYYGLLAKSFGEGFFYPVNRWQNLYSFGQVTGIMATALLLP